ncbi:MAG: hypothetical protein APF84_14660 [Gracilibacter sp. BRH_c7a]|nr:MAG: hypothetical protein APF84_14660 [Gracilibacter sp. BRH_c7a]
MPRTRREPAGRYRKDEARPPRPAAERIYEFGEETMLLLNENLPGYAKGDFTNYILFKFMEEKWQQDYFLDGKMYMQAPSNFHDPKMGEGRSDIFEGSDLVVWPNKDKYASIKWGEKDGQSYFVVEEHKEKPVDYIENTFFAYSSVENKSRNVFCMYALWFDYSKKCISEINDKMLKDFGEYGVVITNRSEFYNRIGLAVNKSEFIKEAKCGFVEYIPIEERDSVIDWNPFLKMDQGYDFQHEFRISFVKTYEGLLEFDLNCSLRDIALPVKTQDVIEGIRFKDEYLYIPTMDKL